jgi:hypothetical protein
LQRQPAGRHRQVDIEHAGDAIEPLTQRVAVQKQPTRRQRGIATTVEVRLDRLE